MIVRCPECGSKGRLSEEFAGRRIRCPQCGGRYTADGKNTVQAEVKWYYAEGQEKRGPLTGDEFERLIEAGALLPDTLVWRKGMAGWRRLAKVQEARQAPSVSRDEQPLPGRDQKDTLILAEVGAMVDREEEAAAAPGLHYGGGGKRFWAKVIDLIFLLTMASMVSGLGRKLFPEAYGAEDIGYFYGAILAVDLLLWSFYTTWFVGKFGATPGKMVFNLKIVTPAGDRVTYIQAFGRFWVELALGLGLALALAIGAFIYSHRQRLAAASFVAVLLLFYVPILIDPRRRGLHDRLSRTRVVIV